MMASKGQKYASSFVIPFSYRCLTSRRAWCLLLAFHTATFVTLNVHRSFLEPASHQMQRADAMMTTALDHGHNDKNFFVILDMWERMVNVQSGLKRLVQLGTEAGFTVVEPFMFESKVSLNMSLPSHFAKLGLKAQTAECYYNTTELKRTNRYVTFEQFQNLSTVVSHSIHKHAHLKQHLTVIDAALHFDWEETSAVDLLAGLRWCDSLLSTRYNFVQEKHSSVWQISPRVIVKGALCVPAALTTEPNAFSSSYFHRLFKVVQHRFKGTQTSIALLNYRKHAFSGFVFPDGTFPFRRKISPLQIGAEPMDMARVQREKRFGSNKYVALQIRTGKAWVLSGRNEDSFSRWLDSCVDAAVRAVHMELKRTGMNSSAVYVASDLYNDGWKGGETCPPRVCDSLRRTQEKLQKSLPGMVHFNPDEFSIQQDRMGYSGLVDAATCVQAERFIRNVPSNLGKWIEDIRSPLSVQPTVKVHCPVTALTS